MLDVANAYKGGNLGRAGHHPHIFHLSDLRPSKQFPQTVRRRWACPDSMAHGPCNCHPLAQHQRGHVSKPSRHQRRSISRSANFRERRTNIPARICRRHCPVLFQPMDCQALVPDLLPKTRSGCKQAEAVMVVCACYYSRFILLLHWYH